MKEKQNQTKKDQQSTAKKGLTIVLLVLNLQANVKEIAMENTNKYYVECENCIYMYHCERTYLGGCDTGVEWKKEEKEKDEN